MKRTVFAFVLLMTLLAASLGVTALMARLHEPMARELNRAVALAETDFPGAVALAKKAKADWDASGAIAACFADHGPMEEIDQEFAQLEVYATAEEQAAFAAICASLAEKVQAMSDAHSLQWRNIF